MSVCRRVLVAAAAVAVASCSPQYGAPPVSSGGQSQSYGAPLQAAAAGQGFSSAGTFSQNGGAGFSQASAAGFGGNTGGRFVSSVGAAAANAFDGQGMPYNFDWAVREPEFSNDFDHQEESDGVVTSGQYRVNLPDGRVQIVTYTVEGDSGFQATVTYEGEAQYPLPSSNQGSRGGYNQGSRPGFSQSASTAFGQQSNGYSQQDVGSGFQSQEGGGVASTPATSYGAF